MAMPMPPIAARVMLPVLPALARAGSRLRGTGHRSADAPQATTPSAEQTAVQSFVWAQATGADGASAEGWLRTGEGYAYTAAVSVSTVEAVLASQPLGATTVAAAFGPGIALSAGELVAAA
jgi:hypothetical protein